MASSPHLDDLIANHNSVANLQVVFVDIEKYSRRRTQHQVAIVSEFTRCLGDALDKISAEYVTYAQANNVNYATDIIRLPTGDGAAIAFTFDGLHDIHLRFALEIVHAVAVHNNSQVCARFAEDGWCNCHTNFNVRVGVSEGKGVVYRDLNDDYNVAGGVINMAARVMGWGQAQQILFTDTAHAQIIDMVDDVDLIDRFVRFDDVRIKHKERITIWQYVDPADPLLNSAPPKEIVTMTEMTALLAEMPPVGLMPKLDELEPEDVLAMTRKLSTAMTALMGVSSVLPPASPPTVEAGPPTIDEPSSADAKPPESA